MQIKELGCLFGAIPFERGAGHLRLTNIEEQLATHIYGILLSIDELEDMARASQADQIGRLRTGVIPTIALYPLPNVIRNLTQNHAYVDLHIREALTSTLLQELAEGRLDTTIVTLPVSDPFLTEVALFEGNLVLVLPCKDEEKPVPTSRSSTRNAFAYVGIAPLFSRPGSIILQGPNRSSAREVGRQLPLHTRADGRRRDWCNLAPRNGGVS